eukprot:5644869-Amphidinium_carterae.2
MAADCLLEDPTFAMEAKREFRLLKLTMLSGRSTVVRAESSNDVRFVDAACRSRLGLSPIGDHGSTMELWHGSTRVPAEAWKTGLACSQKARSPSTRLLSRDDRLVCRNL